MCQQIASPGEKTQLLAESPPEGVRGTTFSSARRPRQSHTVWGSCQCKRVPRPHLRLDITSGRLRRTFNPQTHEHSPTVSKVPPPETDKHSKALRLVSRHSGQSPLHASTQCPGRDRRVYIPSQNITYPSHLRHTFLFCVSYCCL